MIHFLKLFLLIISFAYVHCYGKEYKEISPNIYLDENYSDERKKIVNFLQNQFINKKVNQKMLDNLWNKQELTSIFKMARFQIVNQKIYSDCHVLGHYYYKMILDYIHYLVENYKIADVDFILYLVEQIPTNDNIGNKTLNIPAFIMFQDITHPLETDKILFPDAFFFKKEWGSLLKNISQEKTKYPWNKKISKLFWRGGTTGGVYDIKSILHLDRLKLTILSSIFPNILNAKFAGYFSQFSKDEKGEKLKEFIKTLNLTDKEKVSEKDHLQYKYLISVDGNAATGTRVPWIMSSNSVLVKQESNKIQWYYKALEAYKHYIPLKNDLTDLPKIFTWLENNQDELQNIIRNANIFVENNLQPKDIDAHVVILLNEYSQIQEDKIIIPSLPSYDEVMSLHNLFKNLWYNIKVKIKWKLGL